MNACVFMIGVIEDGERVLLFVIVLLALVNPCGWEWWAWISNKS